MPLNFWSKDYIYNIDIFCIFIQHLLANLFIMPAERFFNNEAISDKQTADLQAISKLTSSTCIVNVFINT